MSGGKCHSRVYHRLTQPGSRLLERKGNIRRFKQCEAVGPQLMAVVIIGVCTVNPAIVASNRLIPKCGSSIRSIKSAKITTAISNVG